MYFADECSGVHYDRHGKRTAELVRDAMKYYADTDLE
ncbi:hypothetical protein HGA13_24450 [Nocardia speluncae]|uniref:Uncharacterized protein n=1 Tax=Nocardia speluncae TaxID=419477 RepID=A0A846XLI6_9NOCA|nr:hypothetical protein [Nocardia speluncae]